MFVTYAIYVKLNFISDVTGKIHVVAFAVKAT